MRRCDRLADRWDAWGWFGNACHALFCRECRRAWRVDRQIEQSFRTLREEPVPEEGEARIFEALGLPTTPRHVPLSTGAAVSRLGTRASRGRRALVVALPMIAGALVLLLLTLPAPAEALERALNAMAQVHSAHCRGWYMNYRAVGRGGKEGPARMRLEMWYRAPEQFRWEIRPQGEERGMCPQRLVVNGNTAVRVVPAHRTASHHHPGVVREIAKSGYTQNLTPLDFFTPRGFLHRARQEKNARVAEREGTYGGKPVRILSVQADGWGTRHDWVLHVDAVTNLVLRAEWKLYEYGYDDRWKLQMRQVLETIQYNVPLNDALFQIPSIEPVVAE